MKTSFTKNITLTTLTFICLSGSAAVSSPHRDVRTLRTERGFELVGHKGDDLTLKRNAIPNSISPTIQGNISTPDARFDSKSAYGITVIVDEDFAMWTEGSEEDPVYTADIPDFWVDDVEMWDISPERTRQPGWAGQALYSAGGALGLCYPNYGGFIQTPRGDYSGNISVSMKIKVCDTERSENPSLFIIFCNGSWEQGTPITSDYGKFQIPNDGDWHEISYMYDNKYGGDDCFIQLNTYHELLVDDIKVVAESNFLPHPEMLPATAFTLDGFTANWGPVAKATDYLISCWRNIPVSNEDISLEEGFESANATDGKIDLDNTGIEGGWEIGLPAIATGDDAISGDISLCFNDDGQTIATPYTGSLITDCKVSIRLVSGVQELIDPDTGEVFQEYVPGYLRLDAYDGYKWLNTGASCYLDMASDKETHTIDFNDIVAGKYYQIRLRSEYFDNDINEVPVVVAIDDFKVTTLPASEKEFTADKLPVEGTSYVFTGLDPESDYHYTVIARNTELGIDSGEPVAGTFAFGLPCPTVRPASDIDPLGAYTANWEKSPKAQEYSIENFKVFTAPGTVEDFQVLEEGFSKLNIGVGPYNPIVFNNVKLMNLDEYCDNIGWVGYLCGISEFAIGGIGVPEYGLGGQLQTPFISLGNDGGKFKVTISTCGTTGDYLYVVNSSGKGGAIPLSEEYTEYTAEFEGGSDFDYLAFYTAYKTPFFINYISVTQNLKSSDKVLNMIEECRTEDTSHRFYGLAHTEENYSYAYDVYAIHSFLSNKVWSPRSEVVYVDLSTEVEGIPEESVKITPVKGGLEIEAPGHTDIKICTVSGFVVKSFTGSRSISLAPGAYIVTSNDKSRKIMVM